MTDDADDDADWIDSDNGSPITEPGKPARLADSDKPDPLTGSVTDADMRMLYRLLDRLEGRDDVEIQHVMWTIIKCLRVAPDMTAEELERNAVIEWEL